MNSVTRNIRPSALIAALAFGALLLPGAKANAQAAPPDLAGTMVPKLNYSAMKKLGWKLSSQAYTFREFSLLDTIDILHHLGIKYIELFPGQSFSREHPEGFDHNSPPERVDELLAKLKSAGITPVCYGVVGLGDDEAEDRKVFDFAKKLHLLNIVSEPPEDALPLIDKLCQEYKINVAIHDHPQPSHYWNPDLLVQVTKGLSHRIGSCSDTGHWYRSGLVPLDCLKELKGRIISLHFKDLSEEKNDVPWGTGVCNSKGMMEELKRQGFKGVFSIEYESTHGVELIDNVAKCCQFFSDEATELAK
jgi:sugar phosphate isomerase/epimerase